jgi:hypothetical protein
MRRRRFALGALAFAALAGCGGGTAHAPAPALPASLGGGGSTSALASAHFSLTIPERATTSSARRAQYISASTLSASITVNPGGVVTNLNLPLAAAPCASVNGSRVCTITAAAPIGNDTASIALYDGACTGGPPCTPTGNVIGAASSFAFTVSEGSSNVTTPLIVGGIPAFVDVTAPAFTAAAPATVALSVTAYDADHNIIVGSANYVDATGTATPLTVALSTSTAQLTLHDGAQSGSSITVAGPTDAPTVQLNAPATILGALTRVTMAGVAVPRLNASGSLVVNGTLTATQLTSSFAATPDYTYVAPSLASQVSGAPDGIAFSVGNQSFGEDVGFFDAATETLAYCATPNFNLGVAPAPSGLVYAFNGAFNVDTTPIGLIYVPNTSLRSTGGPCTATTANTNNVSFAQTLAFDGVSGKLFEGDQDGAYATDAFTLPSFSGHTAIASYGGAPHDLVSLNGTKTFLVGAAATIYSATGSSAPSLSSPGASTLTALAPRGDGSVYALDTSGKRVWQVVGSNVVAYTPANSFSIPLSSETNNLAVAPDGNVYASDGNSTVQSVSPAGTATSYVIPAPGGNTGYIRGLFDGNNGFVYAWYDDGQNAGTEYVFRISH